MLFFFLLYKMNIKDFGNMQLWEWVLSTNWQITLRVIASCKPNGTTSRSNATEVGDFIETSCVSPATRCYQLLIFFKWLVQSLPRRRVHSKLKHTLRIHPKSEYRHSRGRRYRWKKKKKAFISVEPAWIILCDSRGTLNKARDWILATIHGLARVLPMPEPPYG